MKNCIKNKILTLNQGFIYIMSKLDKDAVIAKFTEAYTAANGKAPQIEAKGGWYSVDGSKNMRLAALDEMANELSGSSAPAAKEEVKAKKEPKKTAEKKAPAKKKSAKPANSGFSVKDFWKNQVLAKLPGSKAPR